MQIAVIDLGIGNLRSVAHALSSVAPDADIIVTHDARLIEGADKVVLPGQGAIGTWFSAIEDRQLLSAIKRALDEKPLLGICVGMQALFGFCEEDGGTEGLGLFDGVVRHFRHFHQPAKSPENKLKIPHMGWNQVSQTQHHPLWQAISDDSNFYFVHSYCANLSPDADANIVAGVTDYGHRFLAAVARDNVFAVQFHPEKSHNDGLQLLKNFTVWNGNP